MSSTYITVIYIMFIFFSFEKFRVKKYIQSSILLSIALVWILFYKNTLGIIQNLGGDSIFELNDFDITEAFFYLKTLILEVGIIISLKKFILYSTQAIFFWLFYYYISKYFKLTSKVRKRIKFSIILIATSFFIFNYLKLINLYLERKGSSQNIIKNFDNDIIYSKINREMGILVYIGESTSSMNMNIYGYPRNTTPLLSKLKESEDNLLVFKNVLSTHTHTAPSLLEAFSFGVNVSENTLPIFERKRVSIVDILSKASNNIFLYSNQGSSGSFNIASSAIFKNAHSEFSSNVIGNIDNKVKKPFDHNFFDDKINKKIDDNSIVFFHSYSGHGPYKKFIPAKFQSHVDEFLKNHSPISITGKEDSSFVSEIEEYDSVIKYIDYSLYNAIEHVKNSLYPKIFIYFSDHGDSSYTSRGHDSSRFVHEMIRIPFLIYFNDSAKKAYPNLFKKYKKLSEKNDVISTLAQFPYVITDLLDIEFSVKGMDKLDSQRLIGQEIKDLTPVLIRETTRGIEYININKDFYKDVKKFKNNATNNFLLTKQIISKDQKICYHRSNTLGSIFRGLLVNDCIETDIFINDNKSISVYHPPAKDVGLKLKDVLEIVKKQDKSIWLDAKNLNTKENCITLKNKLQNINFKYKNILLELPSYSYKNKNELFKCVNSINKMGASISYYIPTKLVKECSKNLTEKKVFENIDSCKSLREDVYNALDSKLYTDISFDFRGRRSIEELTIARNFKWNTWNVKVADFNFITLDNYRNLIMKNNDENKY